MSGLLHAACALRLVRPRLAAHVLASRCSRRTRPGTGCPCTAAPCGCRSPTCSSRGWCRPWPRRRTSRAGLGGFVLAMPVNSSAAAPRSACTNGALNRAARAVECAEAVAPVGRVSVSTRSEQVDVVGDAGGARAGRVIVGRDDRFGYRVHGGVWGPRPDLLRGLGAAAASSGRYAGGSPAVGHARGAKRQGAGGDAERRERAAVGWGCGCSGGPGRCRPSLFLTLADRYGATSTGWPLRDEA